ncbi:MAG: helix-turn-helix transcriptional regulator [Hyalangium sp.]|uniref:helix-turn-helix transcriptional regulator n=1 Tax=Hyalangium sp. TaxID=2028555 RepID=UPI00389A6597
MKKGTSEQGRLTRLNRTVQLIEDLLLGKEHDRRTVGARLGLKLAAADRQLAAVAGLRGVVSERKGRNRVYRFDRTALLEGPKLPTAIAACFGASLAPLFAGTTYETAFREARDLIIRQFRRGGIFRHIERKFVFLSQGGEVSLPDESGQLDDLIDAVLHERRVTFDYQDFDNVVSSRTVKPLSLTVYNHQLYLIGRLEDGAQRAFRFSRIKNAEVTESTFEYPSRAEYDPEQVFASSFGVFMSDSESVQRVEVSLAPRWATYVRTHRWHRSQNATFTDKEVRVTLDVHVCPEVEAWVLGFGDEAEVIAPLELRAKVAKKARAMAQRYEGVTVESSPRPASERSAARSTSPRADRKS